MRKKRFLSCLLATGVILTSKNVVAPITANAALSTDSVTTNVSVTVTPVPIAISTDDSADLTDQNLTKILSAVKQKINIPKEYTIFNYQYEAKSSYSDEIWYFYWQNESREKYIYITSDKNANILGYYVYNYGQKDVAKYLKSELQSKALEFIQKVASNISTKVEFTSSSYGGSYRNHYNYVYTRIENGVLMPGQQITVGINASTGVVESFENNSWNYDVAIPEKNIKLTKEQATEKLREQITMSLKYKSNYTTDAKGNTSIKAYLVYEPSVSYLSIDAASGKIYTTLSEWNLARNSDAKESQAAFDTANQVTGGSDSGNLTEEEMKKISELEGLLSKQKAVYLIKKNNSLYLNSEATIITASLAENSSIGSKEAKRYYWNIQFSKPNDKSYYNFYTRAVVDAKTGEIVSFYSNVPDYYYYQNTGETIPTVKYTKTQSQKIFEDFANSRNKERFTNTKLSSSDNQYLIDIKNEKEVYGGYSFNYNRVYNKIDYADNQIYGAVDAVTGKIISYGYYWNDSVAFESATNVISPTEAYDAYMQYEGFSLVYELNTIKTDTSSTQEARLVYQVAISPAYVSPFTGKQLDYNGNEYNNQANSYQYTDIDGHTYERSIKLLADLGAGFTDAKFQPDRAITREELQKLVEAVTYVNLEYTLNGYANITRQEVAVFAINILGFGKIASISGIYQTGADDVANIKDSYVGFVALAKGFGILTLNDKNEFRPTENLTRAEAADMLIKIHGLIIN